MEDLIKYQCSKRASNVTPHIVKILQEHSERLLKIEAKLSIISNDQAKQPACVEVVNENIKQAPDNEDNECKVINTREQVEDIDVEIPDEIDPIMVELQAKLCRMNNEADVLTMELETLREIEEAEDPTDEADDDDDVSSVCTVDCREMIKTIRPEMERIGSWSVVEEQCDGCAKVQIKKYKAEKKRKEKERAKAQQAIKQKQKDLIKEEQRELAIKLKNIKKGRAENHGLDNNRQTQMREELRKLATDYQKLDNPGVFNINMYV